MMIRPALILMVCSLISIGFNSGNTPYVFPEMRYFPPMPESEQNPVTVEGAALGRYLFYDTLLSKNLNRSCASCHRQEAAFSDGPKTFSESSSNQPEFRNTPPLFNLAWYPAFFWDGRAKSLEEQVLHPVRDSRELNLSWHEAEKRIQSSPFYQSQFQRVMGTAKPDSNHIAKAIAQFLRTLISADSKYDRVLRDTGHLNEDEFDGLLLMNYMNKGDCLHCHNTESFVLGTLGNFSNTGLDSASNIGSYTDPGLGGITHQPKDYGKFKTPSVRNLVFTAPYMHDGRFKTLEEVLDFYSEGVHEGINTDSKMGHAHQGGVHLNAEEKRKIICFLKSLTDSSFIKNPNFSNPYR